MEGKEKNILEGYKIMLWKDHSGRSVKTHLKMKPVLRDPGKRLLRLHKEKIKDLGCHWSGNEDK